MKLLINHSAAHEKGVFIPIIYSYIVVVAVGTNTFDFVTYIIRWVKSFLLFSVNSNSIIPIQFKFQYKWNVKKEKEA